MQTTPTLGSTTDLPCPVCATAMLVRPVGRGETLVWCEACGWNLAGSARWLRGSTTGLFLSTLLWVPLIIPLAYVGNRIDPAMGYGLDLIALIALFVPAVLRSQRRVDLARNFEALKPRQVPSFHPKPWECEPELAIAPPRPVQLGGSYERVRPIMTLLRGLWAGLFIAGLLALTPLARVAGPTLQAVALVLMAALSMPTLGAIAAALFAVARDRHLASTGRPHAGTIVEHATSMRRTGRREWELVARYRYRWLDESGSPHDGRAREAGRALVNGESVTVLVSPANPKVHAPYPALIYRVPGA